MKKTQSRVDRIWYKALLTPMSRGIFTDAFYPETKNGSKPFVYFTQVDVTPAASKVIVASRFAESGIRMMTKDLAKFCLEPKSKASKADMLQLNTLTMNLKT